VTTPTSKKVLAMLTDKNHAPPINVTHVNNITSKNDVTKLSASSSIPKSSTQTPSKVALSQGVVKELENARRKIIDLEEQLAELKRISIRKPYPNAEQSLYLRNVVSVLDLNDRIASTRAAEDGETLSVSGTELFKKKIVGEQHEMVAEENDADLEEETRKEDNDNSEDDDETKEN
ncbi:unnamed protein product, partial [Didymodactylos carnosus]